MFQYEQGKNSDVKCLQPNGVLNGKVFYYETEFTFIEQLHFNISPSVLLLSLLSHEILPDVSI